MVRDKLGTFECFPCPFLRPFYKIDFYHWTERPSGSSMCYVQSVNNVTLQYYCRWAGGTPEAQLSFPALSNTSSGAGNLSLTVTATDDLDGKTVTCQAFHPLEQDKCNITASTF